ncbi:arginine deiminase family protein [Streptomyces sp. NPDC048057]|uniref:dimethylarginine dimethylaminohydrolase family protein n=1 Tax=Streptomyces sp. NPDC048057 TaxID=3155628 RepID=UPI0034033344
MTTTGSELSTHGGPGWVPRVASHVDDVAAGEVWTPCGYRSETAALRSVLLVRPPDSIAAVRRPDDSLMLGSVDLPAMRAQCDALADRLRDNGVEVHLTSPAATPNVVFARDLFWMTPAGAVLARMASAQRAGEERHAALALAEAGFPILRTVSGTAVFEGADALWIDPSTVLVGTGFRTNAAGAAEVASAVAELGARVVTVPLAEGVQHLLGTVMFLDPSTAAVHRAACTPELAALLAEYGYRVIALPPDEELLVRRGMNLLVLAPGRVLMPAGCPGIRRTLERAGVAVDEIDIGEYLRAAGGIGCVAGVVRREH